MINLNNLYWVKLSNKGKKIYKEYYENLSIYKVYNQPDIDGWIKLQLWQIMKIFGYNLSIGLHNLPFDDMNLYDNKPD